MTCSTPRASLPQFESGVSRVEPRRRIDTDDWWEEIFFLHFFDLQENSQMQKKLIALAVAGLASGIASAQTNVTMYGVA
jgi:hypothetical protein